MKNIFNILLGIGIAILSTASCTYAYTQEQQEAYQWAYKYNITTQPTIEKAKMNENLTRQAFAKMIVNYLENVIGINQASLDSCYFPDENKVTNDLKPYARKTCALNIMGTNGKNFNPTNSLSRAQLGTVLSRILWGDKHDSSGKGYYVYHVNALQDAGIMDNINNVSEIPAKRGDVLIMMKRMYDKFGVRIKHLENQVSNNIKLKDDNNEKISGSGYIDAFIDQQGSKHEKLFNQTDGTEIISLNDKDCFAPLDYETRLSYNYAYQWGMVTKPRIINENVDENIKNEYLDERNAYELKLGCGVTNIEFAKMIVAYAKHAGKRIDESMTCSFSNINSLSTGALTAITEMCQLGIIGKDINNFRPNDFITQGEFYTYLSRLLWGNKNDGSSWLKHRNALRNIGVTTSNLCDLSFPNYGGDCILSKQQILIMFAQTGDKWLCNDSTIKSLCSNSESDDYEQCPMGCRRCDDPIIKLACSDKESEYYKECPASCREF